MEKDENYTDIFDELTFMSRSCKYYDDYYTNLIILGTGITAFTILNYFS